MAVADAVTKRRVVPSDLSQIETVTRVEFIRNLRRKRLLVFVIILAIISALELAVPPFYGGYPDHPILGPYAFAQNFTAAINFLAILLAVFYGGDALVSEFHNRTGYATFPNPVRRSSIFLGKLFASLLACILVLTIYYIIIASAMAVIYGRLVAELLYSFSFAILYMSASLGVAFAISAMTKTTTSALVLTFVLFFFVFNMLTGVLMIAHVRAEPLLTFQAGVITNFLNGPYPESYPPTEIDLGGSIPGFEMTIFNPTVVNGIIICVIWLVASLLAAYFIFRRREMLG